MVCTLLSGPMVYALSPCFPRKMVYTIAFFCSVTLGLGDRPRKEGCHGGGVYSFFPGPRQAMCYLQEDMTQTHQE